MPRERLAAVLVAIVLAGGVGVYLLYDQVLRGDAAPELALPSVAPSASTPGATSGSGEALTAATAAGDWIVTTGEAGYRVREQLASLPAESDAVGRTTDVAGTATTTAGGDSVRLTAATIEVDTTTIRSDEDRRDDRLRSQGLETDRFPTATFVLTDPVDVPPAAFDGTVVDLVLRGDLTLHGVTNTVDIPAKAQVTGSQISVQGSITFPLSDFDIVAPNIGGFIVSIADDGALEFVVTFARG